MHTFPREILPAREENGELDFYSLEHGKFEWSLWLHRDSYYRIFKSSSREDGS